MPSNEEESPYLSFQGSAAIDEKLAQKLRSIHSVTVRKHKLSQQYKQNLARKAALRSGAIVAQQTPSKRPPPVQPFWLAHKSNKSVELDDPIDAIDFVMTSFRLGFEKK